MDEPNPTPTPEHSAPCKRPSAVKWGLILLVIALIVGIANAIITPTNSAAMGTSTIPSWYMPAIIIIAIVVGLLLIAGIAIGMRWVLHLYLVLFLIGIIVTMFNLNMLTIAYLIQAIVIIIAMLFLYSKPGTQWFRERKARRNS